MGDFLDQFTLANKVALVIGAGGRGMGFATTRALAEAGATVVAVDVSEENVQQARAEAESLGVSSFGIVADVLEDGAVERAVASALDQAGRIDCLVNVAGGNPIGSWNSIDEFPTDVYDTVLRLNLGYVFVACREVGRHMIERGGGGSIVSYSSSSGFTSAPHHGPYGAAKAGIMSLTRTMALEWGQHGIRVNAVAPGSVQTYLPRQSADGEVVLDRPGADEHAKAWAPLQRRLQPEELAGTVLFLLTDLARGITGQTIYVDAGITVRSPAGELSRFAERR